MARLVYGKRPVEEALAHMAAQVRVVYLAVEKRPTMTDLAQQAAGAGLEVQWLDRAGFRRLCGEVNHQGVALELGEFAYTSVKDFLARRVDAPRLVLALDGVTDPQNFGSCLRAAAAFGASLVITTKHRGCPVTPVVTRVSAGATEVVPIARETNLAQALQELKRHHFWVYGFDHGADTRLPDTDLAGNCVLVLGSEGEGLHRLIRDTCDALLAIPAPGVLESLNVAQAAAITLYEATRRR